MACAWNTLCQQLLLVLQAKCAVGLADPLAELTCIPYGYKWGWRSLQATNPEPRFKDRWGQGMAQILGVAKPKNKAYCYFENIVNS